LGALAFSDDHGSTWKLGAEIPSGNESGIACLNDGTILFHSRSTPLRLSGKSVDGGQTISELFLHNELPDPSDNGSLVTLKSGDMICTHNHDSDLRRRTVAKLSRDGGVTWPKAILLESESSAYSTACELSDGRIGVLFERYGYTEMVFCRFSLDELKETKDVLPLEVDENDIEFQVTLRYVRPGRDRQALERLTSLVKRNIPTVDMSVFKFSERKEIGPNSGSASGDPIFTKEEFDQILGPVSPGLKVGDELRFSGRLQNHSSNLLADIKIESLCQEKVTNISKLSPGEKITFMDLRYRVRREDLEIGEVSLVFKWSATHPDLGSTSGQISHQISTTSGLSTQ
jgi:sialidase-1